jgi:hypothetical protein
MQSPDISMAIITLSAGIRPLAARLSRAPRTISESDFTLQRLPFSGMFHIVRHTTLGPARAKTAVDLSGSSTLPFPNVPCSLTPPQSPATLAPCGDKQKGIVMDTHRITLKTPRKATFSATC